MEARVNKKFNPATVYGETTINATVEELNLAIDSLIDQKKLKSITTTDNEIDIVFKKNWIGVAGTAENICSKMQLIIEPQADNTLKLLYAFTMRQARKAKIYGIISSALLAFFGVMVLFVYFTRGSELQDASMMLPISLGLIAFAVVMFFITNMAWSSKRQLKIFDKIFIKKLGERLVIVQEEV